MARPRWTLSKAVHWLRWLHVMLGLQSMVALFVYAVSGLVSTWEGSPAAPSAVPAIETRSFVPREGESDLALAKRLHAEMGLPLTRAPEDWVVRRDAAGVSSFRVYSPNGLQHFRVSAPGEVQLGHQRVGLGQFLLHIHAHAAPRRGSGDDLRLVLWSIYNELSMFALGAFAISGVALWSMTRPRAVFPLIAFVAGCASCTWLAWSSW